MKRIVAPLFAVAAGFILTSGTLDANPCVCPKRMVRGQTVDLRPLMNWWGEPKGVRPLSGWKHMEGAIVRETSYGWVIEVTREDHGAAERFFLRNPPRDRLRRFQALQQELAELKKTSAVAAELAGRAVYTDWYSYNFTQWAGPAQSLAEYRQAQAALSFLCRRIAAIRDELAPMQDASGQFKLDAFALKCDESFEGLPVYDYGSTAPFGD